MHSFLYVLARQHVEEQLSGQRRVESRPAASRGRTLYRARRSLGIVLVMAGNRLLVSDPARSGRQYFEQAS